MENNESIFDRNDDENSMNIFEENKNSLFNENDEEEDNLIYKTKDVIINNISEGLTAEMTNNNLSEPNKNYVIQKSIESFNIPPINVDNNPNQEKKKCLGRKKKNSDSVNLSNRNKFSKDNLIHKFKTIFYQKFLITLTDNLVIICLGKDSKIRKVNSDFIKDLTINLNLEILQKTLADYFTFKISKKYTKQEENSNEKNINNLKKILNSNEKFIKFNKLINTKIEDLYQIFIKDDCVEIIKNEFNLDLSEDKYNCLNYFLNLEKDPKYRECLEKACKNIYSFFDKQKARKFLK